MLKAQRNFASVSQTDWKPLQPASAVMRVIGSSSFNSLLGSAKCWSLSKLVPRLLEYWTYLSYYKYWYIWYIDFIIFISIDIIDNINNALFLLFWYFDCFECFDCFAYFDYFVCFDCFVCFGLPLEMADAAGGGWLDIDHPWGISQWGYWGLGKMTCDHLWPG